MKKKLFLAGMIALILVIASCEKVAGPAGANGKDGTDGVDGISLVWKGSLATAPANPVTNWAYYNTADGKAYIYNGTAWQTLVVDGQNGQDGTDGADGVDGQDGFSLVWKGSLAVAPANPETNWAYYNTADGKAYIYNGTAWQTLAVDGQNGQDGTDGISIVWKGSLAAAPANPVTNWAYYNTALKTSYIWDGTAWQILAVGVYSFTTPIVYRTMVSLAGGTITTTSDSDDGFHGVFIANRPSVTLSAFKIAKYETTYQLWKEVYDWAIAHGYTFANPGWEGHGTSGTGTVGTAAEKATRPVTAVNWRDAIVWCNAYSEMSGKAPVYYTDDTYTVMLKVSTNDSGTATAADGAKMKPGADGYRLPTEAEWEYAARGGNQSDTANWGYTYSGSDTAGDVAWYRVNSGDLGSSDPDYGAHPVGGKAANSKGLYDMSGNVWEWCWDWWNMLGAGTPETGTVSGTDRVLRGGGWRNYAPVAYRSRDNPNMRADYYGFRVVCGN